MQALERPYLYAAPMVLALIDGSKTETRRFLACSGDIVDQPGDRWERFAVSNVTERRRDRGRWLLIRDGAVAFVSRPYAVVGDGMWVKETWRVDEGWDNTRPRDIPSRLARRDDHIYYEATKGAMRPGLHPGRIRQSIFMPRWASRITRKITGVRVELLKNITDDGAKREGVVVPDGRTIFARLWDQINGDKPGRSWADNPLVVVTTFEGP